MHRGSARGGVRARRHRARACPRQQLGLRAAAGHRAAAGRRLRGAALHGGCRGARDGLRHPAGALRRQVRLRRAHRRDPGGGRRRRPGRARGQGPAQLRGGAAQRARCPPALGLRRPRRAAARRAARARGDAARDRADGRAGPGRAVHRGPRARRRPGRDDGLRHQPAHAGDAARLAHALPARPRGAAPRRRRRPHGPPAPAARDRSRAPARVRGRRAAPEADGGRRLRDLAGGAAHRPRADHRRAQLHALRRLAHRTPTATSNWPSRSRAAPRWPSTTRACSPSCAAPRASSRRSSPTSRPR